MRKPTIREVGPEYPGEGAIKTIHSRVYLGRMLWEYTKKLKRYRKSVLITHQKKKKRFQKGILEVKAATYTWRESGYWVALNNNTNWGSTHKSDWEMEWSKKSHTYADCSGSTQKN